ncbi:MAG TPA: hypothetical protein VI564_09385, partial [Candidatus Nanoarchaeia archaeon]|nr:hypothetical protein [Candidatus Nanoarchaeia archaeon]
DTSRADDFYNEANAYLGQNQYQKSYDASKKVLEIKELALSLRQSLDKIKSDISDFESKGIGAGSEKDSLRRAEEEFAVSNYEKTQSEILKINSALGGFYEKEIKNIKDWLSILKNQSASGGLKFMIIDSYYEKIKNIESSANNSGVLEMRLMVESLNDSVFRVISAKNSILESSADGLKVSRESDLLKEAVIAAEIESSENVKSITGEIHSSLSMAKEIRQKMMQVNSSLENSRKNGIDLKSADSKFSGAVSSFDSYDYKKASELLAETSKEIEDAESSSLLFGVMKKDTIGINLAQLLRNNWAYVLAFIVLFAVAFIAFRGAISRHMTNTRISRLKREAEAIESLIKKLQEDYYKKKLISKYSYEAALDKHQKRSLEIKEVLPILESKIK